MQNIIVIATVWCALALHFCISAPATTGWDDATTTITDHRQYRSYEDYVYGEGEEGGIVENAPNDSSSTISSHLILSAATGQFVAITKSGRVSGNNPIDRLVSQFYIHRHVHNGRERLAIKSVRYSDRNWYLTINSRGKFRGDIPMNGNEVFEVEPVSNGGYFALRAVYPQNMTHQMSNTMQNGSKESENSTASGSGVGSGAEYESRPENGNVTMTHHQEGSDTSNIAAPQPKCYLGFSSDDARPSCYDSSNYVEVHLQFRGAVPANK
jgi:hypothetical protein